MEASTQAKFTNPAAAGERALAVEMAELDKQVVTTVMGKPVTRWQLSAAFDKVRDSKHWKNPIDAEVELNPTSRAMIGEAITFFTGSVATFKPVKFDRRTGRATFRVTAAGYFAVIGA